MQNSSIPFRKPFEYSRYQKYDAPAKELLVSLLKRHGHTILDTKEDYSADVVSSKNGKVFYSEAEIKKPWTGVWPSNWSEIRIPERKKKLIQKHGTVWFYLFSGDFKRCWRICSDSLNNRMLRQAAGRNIYDGEEFYHIPFQQALLVEL